MAKRNKIDDENDDEIVPDGFGIRVKMNLMDGRRVETTTVFDARDHRPHFAELSDAQQRARAEARDAWIDRTANAWRTLGRDQKPELNELEEENGDDPDEDGIDDRERRQRARDAYIQRLNNAWRRPSHPTGFAGSVGPANVGALPTNRVGGGDSAPHRLLSKDAADAQRNAAWSEMCERLANAWRNP